MKHGSLFSGIGGFDLAAQWAGFENIFQVEIDNYCQKVLEKNFPNVKRYKDIKEFDGTEYTGTIDIISGGFPCQPFSVAGKQKGAEDDRNLWPEMFRVIQEIRPAWVLGENVANIVNFVEFDNILADLEAAEYEVWPLIIPAVAVDAKHRRDRVWIVAHSNRLRMERTRPKQQTAGISGKSKNVLNSASVGWPQSEIEARNVSKRETKWESWTANSFNRYIWETEPDVGRVANGIPRRVDRLKGLGNAIVPQVAFRLFETIKKISRVKL